MTVKRRALTSAILLAGCAPVDATFDEPDVDFNRMLDQPRYDAYGTSAFFSDRAAMRRPPEGTVRFSGEGYEPEKARYPLTSERLDRGRTHFETVCAACHGVAGRGDTPVADRMQLRRPPSLHTSKARNFTDPQLHDIVRDGYGLMPAYDYILDRNARWAVVLYVRALQLSQHADVESLPPEIRRKIEGTKP